MHFLIYNWCWETKRLFAVAKIKTKLPKKQANFCLINNILQKIWVIAIEAASFLQKEKSCSKFKLFNFELRLLESQKQMDEDELFKIFECGNGSKKSNKTFSRTKNA